MGFEAWWSWNPWWSKAGVQKDCLWSWTLCSLVIFPSCLHHSLLWTIFSHIFLSFSITSYNFDWLMKYFFSLSINIIILLVLSLYIFYWWQMGRNNVILIHFYHKINPKHLTNLLIKLYDYCVYWKSKWFEVLNSGGAYEPHFVNLSYENFEGLKLRGSLQT